MGIRTQVFFKDGTTAKSSYEHAGCYGLLNHELVNHGRLQQPEMWDSIDTIFDVHGDRTHNKELGALLVEECKKLFPKVTTINFDEWKQTLLEKDSIKVSVDVNTDIFYACACLIRHAYETVLAKKAIYNLWSAWKGKLTLLECVALIHTEYFHDRLHSMIGSQLFFCRNPYKLTDWNTSVDPYSLFINNVKYQEDNRENTIRACLKVGSGILHATTRPYMFPNRSKNYLEPPKKPLDDYINEKLLEKSPQKAAA